MSGRRAAVRNLVTARLPRPGGDYRLSLFHGDDDKEHLALVRGEVDGARDVLVRIHSECFTGDVLGSERCDCGEQLLSALEMIDRESCGALLYLRQEGRGIGLLDKLKAYNLQDLGYDTVDANRLLGHAPDERDYGLAARILEELGIRSIRLLTNNPAKISGLLEHGVEVRDRVPIDPVLKKENAVYLRTKVERLRHLLDLEAPAASSGGNGGPRGVGTKTPGKSSRAVRVDATADGDGNGWIHELVAELAAPSIAGRRPFVTLTYAQSIDGCIAAQVDRPLAISGPQSRAFTHELRAAHDAILVGIGTVLADDPRLNVRLVAGRDPQRVVLDSRLRCPLGARLLAGSKPWIVAAEDADSKRQVALEGAGAGILRLPSSAPGRISLEHLLRELAERGVHSLMVEGGAAVICSFLASRLVDHLVITVAPVLIGGVPAIARLENGGRAVLPRLRAARYRQIGEDLILWGAPDWS